MATENPPTAAQTDGAIAPPQRNMTEYVEQRYERQIGYYWKAAASNKKTYRWNRTLIIVLGAGVTLLSSLTSSVFIQDNQSIPWLGAVFAIATPAAAAILTIINGLIQSFQSGAVWRDMVLNAERLEKERDRFRATAESEKDFTNELAILNDIVLNESTSFFKRILDSEYEPGQEENEK